MSASTGVARTTVADELDSARAWGVVGATFLSTFTVFGIAYSFGAFFDQAVSRAAGNPSDVYYTKLSPTP